MTAIRNDGQFDPEYRRQPNAGELFYGHHFSTILFILTLSMNLASLYLLTLFCITNRNTFNDVL